MTEKEIIEAIKEKRKANRQTQDQVAMLLGYSQQSYSEIERGIRSPSLASLIAIADVLGMEIAIR